MREHHKIKVRELIEALQVRRARLGMTYRALAERSGVSKSHVELLLRNELKCPSILPLMAIASVMGLEIGEWEERASVREMQLIIERRKCLNSV